MLDRPTPWDHATNEERAEECARFLAVHMLIGLSDCQRLCNRVREMAEGEREARRG